jgi:N-acetylglutamate synthase-like GNAT family acetyltransferase
MPRGTRVEVTSHAERPIDPSGVLELYAVEQWWPDRTRSQLVEVLERDPAVGAWIGDRLVGFACALPDGAFRVYVEDVVVGPDARHAGIRRSLVAGLLELVPTTAVTSLFCSRDLTDFYAEHGFHATSQLVMHRQPDL